MPPLYPIATIVKHTKVQILTILVVENAETRLNRFILLNVINNTHCFQVGNFCKNLWMNLLNSDIAVTVSATILSAFEIWSNTDGLFELYNMRKIFGTYRFNLLYDRLACGFRNPDLGANLDYEIFSRIAVVEERGGMLSSNIAKFLSNLSGSEKIMTDVSGSSRGESVKPFASHSREYSNAHERPSGVI